MAGMSNYLRNELLDHLTGVGAYTAPASLHVQVHTGDPGADGTNNLSEVTARTTATFGAAAARVASNDASIDFDNVTLSADETWSGVSVWDAASAGNCLFYGNLASGVLMQNGDSFAFDIGDLDISLAGAYTTFLANELLDHTLGNGTYTAPAGLHAAMHLADPTVSGTVSPAAETTRADIGAFSAAVAGATANLAVATISNVSTAETYSHVVVHDAATAGNPLLFGALTNSRVMAVGDDAEFAIGELDIVFA